MNNEDKVKGVSCIAEILFFDHIDFLDGAVVAEHADPRKRAYCKRRQTVALSHIRFDLPLVIVGVARCSHESLVICTDMGSEGGQVCGLYSHAACGRHAASADADKKPLADRAVRHSYCEYRFPDRRGLQRMDDNHRPGRTLYARSVLRRLYDRMPGNHRCGHYPIYTLRQILPQTESEIALHDHGACDHGDTDSGGFAGRKPNRLHRIDPWRNT